MIIAVVLAGLGSAVGYVFHLDSEYGPLAPGSFGGFLETESPVLGTRDGFDEFFNSTAVDARVPMLLSLFNNGDHAVTVNSAATDDVITGVQWSSYEFVAGGYNIGTNTPWRSFPATVPAKGTIRLRVTVRRPSSCRNQPITSSGGMYTTGGVNITWKSLLGTHHTYIDGQLKLQIC